MFIYWDGYEIDGSDTDFDLVLPENREAEEFVRCFLSIPVFNGENPPSISYYKNQQRIDLGEDDLYAMLKKGSWPAVDIVVNCCHIEMLPQKLQEEIFSYSKTRDPLEEAYGKGEHPCDGPSIQNDYSGGSKTVSLSIMPPGTKKEWYTEEGSVVEGYVHHPELITSKNEDLFCFSINCGPSFYYEYAMYIVDYLRDHFPGLGTCGGLDCLGGWTEGCTYADSLYQYEKYQFPVKYNVKNTMKRLTEYGIAQSFRQYYKKGWQYDKLADFHLVNNFTEKEQPQILNFSDYIHHVKEVLAMEPAEDVEPEVDSFMRICRTAVHILLPEPCVFQKQSDIPVELERILLQQGINWKTDKWAFCAYLAFTLQEGQKIYEFRVHYKMRPYFLKLLDLIQSGKIEFIKSEMYDMRDRRRSSRSRNKHEKV